MCSRKVRRVWFDYDFGWAILLVGALSCRATPAAPLEEALQACAQERDDSRRLLCYDQEVQNLAHTHDKFFGLTAEQKRKSDPTEARDKASNTHTLASIVSAVSARPDGRLIITLANGQAWVQGEAWEIFHVSVGDAVTIKPGILGSFNLYTPSGLSTRVTRAR